MEIAKNTTELNKKSVILFQNIEILKRSWLVALCSIAIIILSFAIKNHKIVLESIPLLVIGALVYPTYIIILKILFARTNKTFKPTTIEYTFTDEKILIKSKDLSIVEIPEIKYFDLLNFAQTKKYIFLYVNKFTALVVDKSGFTEGTSEKVINLLKLRKRQRTRE